MLRKYLSMMEKNNHQSTDDRTSVVRSISMSHLRHANREQSEMIDAYNFLSSPSAPFEEESTLFKYIDDLVANNKLVTSFNYVIELFVWLAEKENRNDFMSSITVRKSIVSLVRRMRRESSSIRNILIALITNGGISGDCCVINKTQDGRLQVDGNKRFPHILSFQLFRSPYVRSKNDLSSTSKCKHPFHSDDNLVCLNPYHYVLTSLFIQKSLMDATVDNPQLQQHPYLNAQSTIVNSNLVYNPPYNPFEDNSVNLQSESMSSFQPLPNTAQFAETFYQPTMSTNYFPIPMANNNQCYIQSSPFLPRDEVNPIPLHQYQPTNTTNLKDLRDLKDLSVVNDLNNVANDANGANNVNDVNSVNDGFEEIRTELARLMSTDKNRENDNKNEFIPVHDIVTKNKSQYMTGQQIPDSYMFHSDETSTDRYSVDSSTLDFHPIGECGAHNSWCSIIYNEYDNQVGDVTHVPKCIRDAYVDGYTNVTVIKKNCFRLSVAQLNTVSNRDDAINRCINSIGKGIRIKRRSSGNIMIRCLSESGIFIQSYFMDIESKSPVGGAVHKVLTEVSVHVFIWEYFVRETEQSFSLLEQMIQNHKQNPNVDSNYNRAQVTEISAKFKSTVETLQKRCVISLSFVKGWGYNYTRNTVSSTPCWIELYANDALQFLEDISNRFWNFFQETCMINNSVQSDQQPPNNPHATTRYQ